jgi:hypothetical protein
MKGMVGRGYAQAGRVITGPGCGITKQARRTGNSERRERQCTLWLTLGVK